MSLALRKDFLAKKLHYSYEKQNVLETQQALKKSYISKPSKATKATSPIKFTSQNDKEA